MLKLKDPSLLRQQVFIAGEWVDAHDGVTVPVMNPATGGQIGRVPMCGMMETSRAIDAADVAMQTWRQTPACQSALKRDPRSASKRDPFYSLDF